MNILIIEDDEFLAEKISQVFKKVLTTNRVVVLHSLHEFKKQLNWINSYDIILTDLKLWNEHNNKDWYEIISLIRNKNLSIPIVVISWNDNVDVLRTAFDCWASDYLIKPLRLKELEIRILNWFKNHCITKNNFNLKTQKYNELSYNLETNEFYYQNKKIELTKNNKFILSIFFTNPEKILSENYLIEKIWWDFYNIVDRNLRVNILRLKKWLNEFWIDWRIKNIRGEWYLFTAKN